MSRRLTLPEKILQHLAVERPEQIDIEAIAWQLGAKVKYRTLHSCEARIVGQGGRAIISVDDRVPPKRQRFSVAHELGHWHHHRGRCLICHSEDIGNNRRQATDPERVADAYASDMLIPRYLLEPLLREVRKPTLKSIRELAVKFNTSVTATIIKIIETDQFPLMLVCHNAEGRRWFFSAPSIPPRWFPRKELDADSFAFQVLFGNGPEDAFPRRIGADAWFDHHSAAEFEITEQSFKLPTGDVVTILNLPERMAG